MNPNFVYFNSFAEGHNLNMFSHKKENEYIGENAYPTFQQNFEAPPMNGIDIPSNFLQSPPECIPNASLGTEQWNPIFENEYFLWHKQNEQLHFAPAEPGLIPIITAPSTEIVKANASFPEIPKTDIFQYPALPPTPQSFDTRRPFSKAPPVLDVPNLNSSYAPIFHPSPAPSLEGEVMNPTPLISKLQKDFPSMLDIQPPPQFTSPHVLKNDAFVQPSKILHAPLIEKGYKANSSGPHHPKKSGYYSSSGFDMMGVLARVSTRPCPQVSLGPVDASCAFLVCDINQPDLPIVYVSESFEKMTGYSTPDIMGRNCRFLQSPEGIVEQGTPRQFCDHDVVISLKKSVQTLQECQHTLINYKKGGEPFINLLTLIPICWERPYEYTHFVGFQVDLVEKPYIILNRLRNLPTPVTPDQSPKPHPDFYVDLTKLMGVTDISEAQQSFYRALMLQMDLVHSLSLRGIFLYVSPEFCRVLEYKESEILGHHISEFCHPGDLVCILRELKESSNCVKPVHLLYRAKKKNSSYTWLEVSGQCAQGEKNRGKKFMVLSGREKKVVKLHRDDFLRTGGHTDRDFWSKLGLEGIFLHVCPDSKQILDYGASDLEGKSLVDLTHPSDREKILSALELLNENNVVTLTHSIKNKMNIYKKITSYFFPCNGSGINRATFCLHKCTDIIANQTDELEFFPCSKMEKTEDDVFSTFSLNRSTSWQYDLHQLRLENQRLRDELDNIENERGKKKLKHNLKISKKS